MATTNPTSEEDLLCPRCSEIYCVPVLLKCGHNICRDCLHKFWEWKGCRECPVCGTESATWRPPIDLQLKIAADAYQAQMIGRDKDICALHNEKLKIFCKNDEEAICVVCQVSKQHKVHSCCPVEEAAGEKKTEISAMLESLIKQLNILNKTKQQWEDTKSYIQTQSSQCETAIKEEFQKLHRFLWGEENTRLKALKQEESTKLQVMSKKIENIKEQINSLSFTISDTKAALRANELPFLQNYKQTKKRIKCNVREPECVRDILINSAKHLGLLKFGIWKNMVNTIAYAPVVFDPNTAQSNLKFSHELTCVQYSSQQPLPDNPERCTSNVCVLGTTGFKSGKHSWTVEVGQGKDWYIGVARESIQRKSPVFFNPAEGFWVIGLRNGNSLWAQTSPSTNLTMKQNLDRITVELDYEKGKVVFINAENSTVIYTFKDRFTERIFPYFSPGVYKDWKNSSPLTICPQTITVDIE
ncbi:zinc-binding protein A33-like [Leuresthes tenuis]|uniref:zinc-binding protein A33-like n=1 Tax=Leuresthes tenuis TaxID=355514 RepID=UPI003B514CC1